MYILFYVFMVMWSVYLLAKMQWALLKAEKPQKEKHVWYVVVRKKVFVYFFYSRLFVKQKRTQTSNLMDLYK